MVTFVVNGQDIECELTDTILKVKQNIIKQLDLSCKYIDLLFVLDKPMRVLGKFNVEPGKLPRTLDNYKLDRFAFKGSVKLEIEEITDYDPNKPRVPIVRKMSGMDRGRGRGLYLPPVNSSYRSISTFDHTVLQQDMTVDPTFSLESMEDFPALK